MRAKEKEGDDWLMIYGVGLSFVGQFGLLILKILDNLKMGVDGILNGIVVSAAVIGPCMIVFALYFAKEPAQRD